MSISIANLVFILLGEANCNINAKEIFLDSRSKVTSKLNTIYPEMTCVLTEMFDGGLRNKG